jgi:hypothetical protein
VGYYNVLINITLGSKALAWTWLEMAWAQLEMAWACNKYEPGPSRGPMAGSGLARAQARAWWSCWRCRVLLRVCGPCVIGGGAQVVDRGVWAVIGGMWAVSVGAVTTRYGLLHYANLIRQTGLIVFFSTYLI